MYTTTKYFREIYPNVTTFIISTAAYKTNFNACRLAHKHRKSCIDVASRWKFSKPKRVFPAKSSLIGKNGVVLFFFEMTAKYYFI